MNWQRAFARKIGYLVAIVLLLLLLILLGQPSTSPTGDDPGSPGGLLARLRRDNGFSESQLGEIDPTSETIKLATVGMRGIAVNFLWEKANAYKMKKDWTNLSATLRQIANLEPHFIKVWRFQAWNLSYNVSVEFDDYRERYRWVIKGIEYLQEGIRKNQNEPMLLWDTGWFIAQKIGRADESKQFRRLFRQDDDFFRRFNDDRSLEERDNWLVGYEWFERAETMVDQGADLKKATPVVFFSNGPMCFMNHAEALEKDGVFDEKAYYAWKKAGDRWFQFAERSIPTFEPGVDIRLNDKERFLKEAAERIAELDRLVPGVREKIRQERLAQLTDEEKKAYDVPLEQRNSREMYQLWMQAEDKMKITHEQVARRATGPNLAKAISVAKEAGVLEEKALNIDRYRTVVNFEYWRRHAKIEMAAETLAARKAVYEGDEAIAKGDLVRAKERYDLGFQQWRLVLDNEQWPDLKQDPTLGRELIEAIERYRRLLEKRDEQFPTDFVLQDVAKIHANQVEKPTRPPQPGSQPPGSAPPGASPPALQPPR